MSTINRDDYIKGLRELADRLEAHPGAPLPWDGSGGQMLVMPQSVEELHEAVRCYGGNKIKDDRFDGTVSLVDGIPGLNLAVLSTMAGVCTLVETGEVEEYEDVEVITPAETRTVVKTRPKVERVCPDSLLALGTEVPA